LRYPQYTADGFVAGGKVTWVGVTASVFDNAGHSFERFDFPAILSDKTMRELQQVGECLVSRLFFDNSFFNIEFFVTNRGHISIIEFNSRLAFQFVSLFAAAYKNNYLIENCMLAMGREPALFPVERPLMASSCVLRRPDSALVETIPRPDEIKSVIENGLASSVRIIVEEGKHLDDYKQDEYSYRYAIVNIVGNDQQDILGKQAEVKNRLRFVFKSP
jgi:hypothetical protein